MRQFCVTQGHARSSRWATFDQADRCATCTVGPSRIILSLWTLCIRISLFTHSFQAMWKQRDLICALIPLAAAGRFFCRRAANSPQNGREPPRLPCPPPHRISALHHDLPSRGPSPALQITSSAPETCVQYHRKLRRSPTSSALCTRGFVIQISIVSCTITLRLANHTLRVGWGVAKRPSEPFLKSASRYLKNSWFNCSTFNVKIPVGSCTKPDLCRELGLWTDFDYSSRWLCLSACESKMQSS